MADHKLKPLVLVDVFLTHPVDPREPLPHGLAQVGLSGDWETTDVLTLGALMAHPERYLVTFYCQDCPKPQDSGSTA